MAREMMDAEVVMVAGAKKVRVHGIAAVGEWVRITTADMVEGHRITSVEWTGTARDGRVASMVTTVMMDARARRRSTQTACSGRASCRCFHCVS